MTPEFTYSAYALLLNRIAMAGYTPTPFRDCAHASNPAIIRHDVDVNPRKAVRMAEIERDAGIASTYFVMLNSDFYNLLADENMRAVEQIADMGHEIGLHFNVDVINMLHMDIQTLSFAVERQAGVLEEILQAPVTSISWHIPHKRLIGCHMELKLHGRELYNAYDPGFFFDYKYVSDSMMRWRDNPYEYLDPAKYPRLQILTHPLWYSETGERNDVWIINRELDEKKQSLSVYMEQIRPGFQALPEDIAAT